MYFDGEIQSDEVVSEAISAEYVQVSGAKSLNRCARAAAIFTLVIQVMIQVTYHVPVRQQTRKRRQTNLTPYCHQHVNCTVAVVTRN